jgi:hypothetical protein
MLDEAIGLGEELRCHGMFDTQPGHHGGPDRRGKLYPPVRGDEGGHPKGLHPAGDEGVSAVSGGDSAKRPCFQPVCGAVHGCEQIRVAFWRGWKRPNEVDVYLGESRRGRGYLGHGRLVLPRDHGCLTPLAIPAPGSDVLGQFWLAIS